jgi:hypothetical protein
MNSFRLRKWLVDKNPSYGSGYVHSTGRFTTGDCYAGISKQVSSKVRAAHCKSEKRAAAVEFSLVAFPFFMIMGCICETGIHAFHRILHSGGRPGCSQANQDWASPKR